MSALDNGGDCAYFALFGAFLAGVTFRAFRRYCKVNCWTDKVEDISVLLLLPIFFASPVYVLNRTAGPGTSLGCLRPDHAGSCGRNWVVAPDRQTDGTKLTDAYWR